MSSEAYWIGLSTKQILLDPKRGFTKSAVQLGCLVVELLSWRRPNEPSGRVWSRKTQDADRCAMYSN